MEVVHESRGYGSGIPLGKEVDNTIDLRCVADVAHAELEFQKFLYALWRQGERRAFWKMVYQSMNPGEIYGLGKKFHALCPKKEKRVGIKIIIHIYGDQMETARY